ncbi:MAG: sodium/proton-translocating pyrophosphatase, partial [Desulfovibrio sp.]|nr:sodium/proton-translocating pyrophosphatase [Desulfovibrio sp.]
MLSVLVVFLCAALALAYAYRTSKEVLQAGTGSEEMQRIAGAIQEGAQAYLTRQYKTIAVVGVVIALVLLFAISFKVAFGFILGAVLSGAAGFIGMNVSVRANVRTAEAAKGGLTPALNIAFRSGAITG